MPHTEALSTDPDYLLARQATALVGEFSLYSNTWRVQSAPFAEPSKWLLLLLSLFKAQSPLYSD